MLVLYFSKSDKSQEQVKPGVNFLEINVNKVVVFWGGGTKNIFILKVFFL